MKGKITTVLLWLLMCMAPLILFISITVASLLPNIILLSCLGILMIDFEAIGFILVLINPLYQAIANYRFITKKSAFFIWLFLVLLQTPWYFPLIFKENNEWLAIPILVSYIGHYQIIGITVFFAVACLVKYLVHRRKVKKEIEKAPVSEEDGTATNFDC